MARDTPPAADPKPGHAPGYPETTPRDGGDAKQPHPQKKRDPEDGGLDREPGDDADPAD